MHAGQTRKEHTRRGENDLEKQDWSVVASLFKRKLEILGQILKFLRHMFHLTYTNKVEFQQSGLFLL